MNRPLLGRDPNFERDVKTIRNEDKTDMLLRRHPFDQAMTKQRTFDEYAAAIELMFEVCPQAQWAPIMGRLSRKLVKRIQYFHSKER